MAPSVCSFTEGSLQNGSCCNGPQQGPLPHLKLLSRGTSDVPCSQRFNSIKARATCSLLGASPALLIHSGVAFGARHSPGRILPGASGRLLSLLVDFYEMPPRLCCSLPSQTDPAEILLNVLGSE